ncbi:MAG: RnfH family protein [Gammaproteobacteria bacterium]
MAETLLSVEVVYATPERQELIALRIAEGATAAQAIEQSGIVQRFPEVETAPAAIGVFGKLCTPDRLLEDGDRVEIYRPLRADPKELRRQRAAK